MNAPYYQEIDFYLSEGMGDNHCISPLRTQWSTQETKHPITAAAIAYHTLVHENNQARMQRQSNVAQHTPVDPLTDQAAWWYETTFAQQPWLETINPELFSDPTVFYGGATTPVQLEEPHMPEPIPREVPVSDEGAVTPPEVERAHTPKPIPRELQDLADYIKGIRKNCRGGRVDFPSRNMLKNDPKLAGEVSRKTGCLRLTKRGGKLREWAGDERLFDQELWQFLLSEDDPGKSSASPKKTGGRKRKDSGMESSPPKKRKRSGAHEDEVETGTLAEPDDEAVPKRLERSIIRDVDVEDGAFYEVAGMTDTIMVMKRPKSAKTGEAAGEGKSPTAKKHKRMQSSSSLETHSSQPLLSSDTTPSTVSAHEQPAAEKQPFEPQFSSDILPSGVSAHDQQFVDPQLGFDLSPTPVVVHERTAATPGMGAQGAPIVIED